MENLLIVQMRCKAMTWKVILIRDSVLWPIKEIPLQQVTARVVFGWKSSSSSRSSSHMVNPRPPAMEHSKFPEEDFSEYPVIPQFTQNFASSELHWKLLISPGHI